MSQHKTVAEQLMEAGYDYRQSTIQPHKRQVFRREDGKVIGDFDVFEAIDWLKSRRRRLLQRPGFTKL